MYFWITDSTRYRAPMITLKTSATWTSKSSKKSMSRPSPRSVTGLKAFCIANALTDIGAPKEIISPLVQRLPKLWRLPRLRHVAIKLNPIRMGPERGWPPVAIACDFKCGFDRDNPRWQRLDLPSSLFFVDYSPFEQEINQLRTYQGQSNVYVINAKGTILAPTFGGGANSLVSEMLGDDAIISSDFGGNPPYEKMKEVARICFKHWLKQSNVSSSSAASRTTPTYSRLSGDGRCAARALQHAWSESSVCRGRARRAEPGARHGRRRDTCQALALPYRFFGFDSDMSDVIGYAKKVNEWMKAGGREQIAAT